MLNHYMEEIEKIATDNNENKPAKENKVVGMAKKIGRSAIDAKVNGGMQEALSYGGMGVGTALAMAKGKKIPKAIATGGLAGMAAGDIAGSLTIPTKQLDRQHKKEFGEKADAKSKATILAANVLPTAALWGVALGNKNVRGKLQKGISDIPMHGKRIAATGKAIKRDYKNVNKLLDKQTSEGLNEAKKLESMINSKMPTRQNNVKKSLKSMIGATAAIGVGGQLAEIPTYIATPRNVVDAKKKRLEKEDK